MSQGLICVLIFHSHHIREDCFWWRKGVWFVNRQFVSTSTNSTNGAKTMKQTSLSSFFSNKRERKVSKKSAEEKKRKREEIDEEKDESNATVQMEDRDILSTELKVEEKQGDNNFRRHEERQKKRRLNVVHDNDDININSNNKEEDGIIIDGKADKDRIKEENVVTGCKGTTTTTTTTPDGKSFDNTLEDKSESYESDEEEEEEEDEEKEMDNASNLSKSSQTKKSTPSYSYDSYDPKNAALWKAGQNIKITEIMCNCFRTIIALTPLDLVPAVYLSINKLAPAHEGIELGVGESLIIKAISEATSKSKNAVKERAVKEGDLGTVAQQLRSTQRLMFPPKPLTVQRVYKDFREIATSSGKNAQTKKTNIMKTLLISSKECEPLFITRSLQGKLRIRLGEETVLAALAHAVMLSKCSNRPDATKLRQVEEKLKSVFSEMPCYDRVIPALLEHGFDKLYEYCHLTPGIPIRPMLAKAAKEYSEVFDRYGEREFSCEWKYDGERAQIHRLDDGTVHIYSRNLENNTSKYPDITQLIPEVVLENTKSFIIDCEVVAFDHENNKIRPFQVLSTRGRKNIKLEDIRVKICLFVFDCIFLNGKPYLRETLKARREVLYSHFSEIPGKFQFAKYINTSDSVQLQDFLKYSVEGNCEGLIVKDLETTYEPSKRSLNWIKLKKDYLSGLGDSFDLVVVGAFKGTGKRTGVYGGFLLACYEPETEEYQTITKIGTGFSDEFLQTITKTLDKFIIEDPKPYYRYSSAHKPDVWFDLSQVWEVLGADLTISPNYQAAVGIVDEAKGISLRFPRFIRIRDDKKPHEATSSEQVAEAFRNQNVHKK